jgi:hypothetical protein
LVQINLITGNQIMAAGADRVVLVVSGLPVCIKGNLPHSGGSVTKSSLCIEEADASKASA